MLLRCLYFESVFYSCVLGVTVVPLALTLPKPYESHDKPTLGSFDVVSPFIPFSIGDRGNSLPTILDSGRMIPSKNGLTWWLPGNESFAVYASQDSFVRGSIEAAAQHQHLEIRPEEVWMTILAQMNFYFKKHQSDKEVVDHFDNVQRNASQVYYFALVWVPDYSPFELEIRLRNKTDWLLDWIKPNFTTSSEGDASMADFIMMADSTPSSGELAPITCENGIPSFTLLGTQKDWQRLLLKVEKLEKFGAEAAGYGKSLYPIISRFVRSFQEPNSVDIRQFWTNMVTTQEKKCHTTRKISGWINGFHHWDEAGNLLSAAKVSDDTKDDLGHIVLDSVTYPRRDVSKLPTAYYTWRICTGADAPGQVEMWALGGVMGKMITKGIPQNYEPAMEKANFTLPSIVADSHHSILKPLYAYTVVDKPTGRKLGECGCRPTDPSYGTLDCRTS